MSYGHHVDPVKDYLEEVGEIRREAAEIEKSVPKGTCYSDLAFSHPQREALKNLRRRITAAMSPPGDVPLTAAERRSALGRLASAW